jgi:hypothetical protein
LSAKAAPSDPAGREDRVEADPALLEAEVLA